MELGPQIRCRHFTGYRPCKKHYLCDQLCPHLTIPAERVLIIHLDAMGAVLRSTALLPALLRRHPSAHVSWITQSPSDQLLKHNPYIDQILTTSSDDLLILAAQEFDVVYCIDKSLKAVGIAKLVTAKRHLGFSAVGTAIVPATPEAKELWRLGLSDEEKLFRNVKSELQLTHEALDLGIYHRDPYVFSFMETERMEVLRRRKRWSKRKILVGINTGCSPTIPYKKLSISTHRRLIEELRRIFPTIEIVLLGGRDEMKRNEKIGYGLNVVQSPTHRGLRDGFISAAACDIIISGDSLGMHMAIALGKWVVAWFGPTCSQEIDLFDRGVKVLAPMDCSPCWKRECNKNPMCYDLVPIELLVQGVAKGLKWLASTCSSKPLILEHSPLLP